MSLTLGISSVVFESAAPSESSPDMVARHCQALGLRAVELRPDYLGAGRSPAEVAEILAAHGLSTIYATNTALAAQPADAGAESPLRADLGVARALGARMLRIFPGDLGALGSSAVSLATTWARASADAGVQLVLENIGNGPGSDLRALAEFVRRVPGLRLNVDVGNAAQAGFDVPRIVADVRDVTAMVHLKGLPDGAASPPGAINFAAVTRALNGWNGPACFEQDAGPAPWQTLAEWVRWMRSNEAAAPGTEA